GIRQCEMMRSDFSRNPQPTALCIADHLYGPPGAQMSDVIFSTSHVREDQVARNHGFFSRRRNALQAQTRRVHTFVHDASSRKVQVLAMLDDRNLEHLGVFESAAK